MPREINRPEFVLITTARDEACFIEATIQSVVSQSLRPVRWIIVDDNSHDFTGEIIDRHAAEYAFIISIRLRNCHRNADFSSKIEAFNVGLRKVSDLGYRYIANLDADITLDPDYFEKVLELLEKDRDVGIAGGCLYQIENGVVCERGPKDKGYVPGGIQVVRRECFETIGGYLPLRFGGEDTAAIISAKMAGWKTMSSMRTRAFHHRLGAKVRGGVRECIRDGRMYYGIGSHAIYEVLRSLQRITRRPFVIHSILRMVGYLYGYVRFEKRIVSSDFIDYLRKSQMKAIREKSVRFYTNRS